MFIRIHYSKTFYPVGSVLLPGCSCIQILGYFYEKDT